MTSVPIGTDGHGNTVHHPLYFAPLPVPQMPRAHSGKSDLIKQIIADNASDGVVVHYLDLKAIAAGPRRTVRIIYRRVSGSYDVVVVAGDVTVEWICTMFPSQSWSHDRMHALIEREAASAARSRGLGISRMDVD